MFFTFVEHDIDLYKFNIIYRHNQNIKSYNINIKMNIYTSH
jgi:hypothetical protein